MVTTIIPGVLRTVVGAGTIMVLEVLRAIGGVLHIGTMTTSIIAGTYERAKLTRILKSDNDVSKKSDQSLRKRKRHATGENAK